MNILINSQMNFESFVRVAVEEQVLYKEKSLMQVALITAKKKILQDVASSPSLWPAA